MNVPSMDDKATPSPPTRQVWQSEADKLLGFNSPPWPTDDQRQAALIAAGREHWLPGGNHKRRTPMKTTTKVRGKVKKVAKAKAAAPYASPMQPAGVKKAKIPGIPNLTPPKRPRARGR